MKKIACLSALAAVLAFTAGTSVAATSTVTGGYAQSDAQGQMNKMGGFNLKYRYEEDLSLIHICLDLYERRAAPPFCQSPALKRWFPRR